MKIERDWKDKVKTLETMIEDIIEDQEGNEEEVSRLNEIIDLLYEYNIPNITIGDIIVLMEKELGRDIPIDDKSIIEFIANDNNREKLIEYGDLKNPIDTKNNDAEQGKLNRDFDDSEPTMF